LNVVKKLWVTSDISQEDERNARRKADIEEEDINKKREKLKSCVKLSRIGLPIIFVVFSIIYFGLGFGLSLSG
jgi:hypothetical protein